MTLIVSTNHVCPSVSEKHENHAVHEAVEKYLASGWRVLPFNITTGICHLTNYDEAHFTCTKGEIPLRFPDCGVGVSTAASNLVDVDVDCAEAVAFATLLLPKTATVGRLGKPTSHMLYVRNGDISSKHFCDLGGEEMVALLTKNRLALPPTVHVKTGHALIWTESAAPTHFKGDISQAIAEVATLSLITRHWPGPHARHEPTLALSGMLARANWPLGKALDAVQLIAQMTNDSNLADRLNEVKSSYVRYEEGKNVTGIPTLAELLSKTPHEAKAIESKIREWLQITPEPGTPPPALPLEHYIFGLQELYQLPEPQLEHLVVPFLPKPSLSMVYANRGVGKTWFTLHLALCLAKGVDFFAWTVPKPRRVLLIDGEMPVNILKYRLQILTGSDAMPDNLLVLPVARMWSDDTSLTINRAGDQARIEKSLVDLEASGRRPDLLVFDNLSALMVGVDENSNSELDDLLRWLVKLRSKGYAVLFVHHSGKNGSQRGSSRKEDLLDTSIELLEKSGATKIDAEGARFEIRFTKERGEKTLPRHLCVTLLKDEHGKVDWHTDNIHEAPMYLRILRAIQESKSITQSELATKFAISKQAINKHVKIAREKELLEPYSLNITEKGSTELKAAFAKEDALAASL